MINRIRNYDYINRELQITIYNTGWSEGYTAGYQDGQAFNIFNRITVGVFLLVTFITGIAIGVWL